MIILTILTSKSLAIMFKGYVVQFAFFRFTNQSVFNKKFDDTSMTFNIVIIQVKTGNSLVIVTVLTFFNDSLLNCRLTNALYECTITKEIHPFSYLMIIKVRIFICNVINPRWIFYHSHTPPPKCSAAMSSSCFAISENSLFKSNVRTLILFPLI